MLRYINVGAKKMKEKCNKYEAYFTFRDEKELLEHVENCPDCKIEHEKMQKVSDLIGEVRPYFLAQKQREKKKLYKLKAACFSIALIFFALGGTALNYEYDIVNSIVYHNLSAEDLGFPTDEYGLIMVE